MLKQDGPAVASTAQSHVEVKAKADGHALEGAYNTGRLEFGFNIVISADNKSFAGYAADQNGLKPVSGIRVLPVGSSVGSVQTESDSISPTTTELLDSAKTDNVEGIKNALARGSWINQKDDSGDTALMIAAYNGKTQAVEYLCQNGADINAWNPQKATALIYAAYYNQIEVARVLLKYKPDKSIRDKYGNTAWDYANRYQYSSLIYLLEKADNQSTTDIAPVQNVIQAKTDSLSSTAPNPARAITTKSEPVSSTFPTSQSPVQATTDGGKKIVPVVNPSEPWTGKWLVDGSNLSGGVWALKQSGQMVSSTDESWFKAAGSVSGDKLVGSYETLRRDFEFRFVISSDGMSFEGYAVDQNGLKPARGIRVH